MSNKVTIQSIAKSLNLSRNTVSKALNGGKVPPHTLHRVLNRAKELNYKSLGKAGDRQVYRILLLVGQPLSTIPYHETTVKSIERICFDYKYTLYQNVFLESDEYIESLKTFVKDFNIDGIICVEMLKDINITKILKLNKPTVFIDFSTKTFHRGDFDIILPSTYDFSDVIKNYFKKGEKKRFSYIGDIHHCLAFKQRYYETIMCAYDYNIIHYRNEDILRKDDYGYGDPMVLKEELAPLCEDKRLMVCANDFIAETTYKAVLLLNKRVPEDIEIIGFDNVYKETPRFKLNTFDVGKESLGEAALKKLIIRIESEFKKPMIVHLSTKYIQGNTLIVEK